MPEESAAAPGGAGSGLRLPADAPLAAAVGEAIHAGDLESLRQLLSQNPGLAAARIVNKAG